MQTLQNMFVEVFNKAAGLAIPEERGYRFVAAKDYFIRLEKRRYESIAAIERAAAEVYISLFPVEPAVRPAPVNPLRNSRPKE